MTSIAAPKSEVSAQTSRFEKRKDSSRKTGGGAPIGVALGGFCGRERVRACFFRGAHALVRSGRWICSARLLETARARASSFEDGCWLRIQQRQRAARANIAQSCGAQLCFLRLAPRARERWPGCGAEKQQSEAEVAPPSHLGGFPASKRSAEDRGHPADRLRQLARSQLGPSCRVNLQSTATGSSRAAEPHPTANAAFPVGLVDARSVFSRRPAPDVHSSRQGSRRPGRRCLDTAALLTLNPRLSLVSPALSAARQPLAGRRPHLLGSLHRNAARRLHFTMPAQTTGERRRRQALDRPGERCRDSAAAHQVAPVDSLQLAHEGGPPDAHL